MSSPMTPRQIAQSYWDAEMRRDTDAVLEHFHPDAVLETPNGVLRGRDEIRTFYAPMFEEYPTLAVRIVRDITNGDWAMLEYDAVLTRADGKVAPLQGCNVVNFRDEMFYYLRGYFDPSAL